MSSVWRGTSPPHEVQHPSWRPRVHDCDVDGALTLRKAVADVYRRAFRPPFEVPAALLVNALLMTAAWFLLPPRAHQFVFGLTGPLAFPVIMASWMLGDTPSTNVAGHDKTRALAVLDDGAAFVRWLAARCIVLTSLVGVPCAIIALIIGDVERQSAFKVIAACVVIAIIPFGILPVAAWVGLLLPYHLRPLRWRWDRRRNWRLIARWALLAFSPFVIVPVVSAVIIFPSAALAHWAFGAPAHKLTNAAFVLVAVTVCAMAVLVGIGGLWVAGRLRARRHDRLATYLLDPAAG